MLHVIQFSYKAVSNGAEILGRRREIGKGSGSFHFQIKFCQSTKELMATIVWDCDGILLIDFKEGNITVNRPYYVALLHQLQKNIRKKRQGKLTKGVCLPHDNAAA